MPFRARKEMEKGDHQRTDDRTPAPSVNRKGLTRTSTAELELAERGPLVSPSGDVNSHSTVSSSELNALLRAQSDGDECDVLLRPATEPQQHESSGKHLTTTEEIDVDKYMARREMSAIQERMNAITVIPGAFYCVLFLLSGAWLGHSVIDETRTEMMSLNANTLAFDDSSCLSYSWLPHLHALPPMAVIAGAAGIILHAPFSFIYHWSFAHRLPPGLPRTNHWSRRLDQAMLHVCSASMAYATSGRLDFFLVNLLFNMDCIYRQFQRRVIPRRNQIRIVLSVSVYTLPILRRGDIELFSQLWFLFVVSFWLFAAYPIGGWSHSAFHLITAFLPPLLMEAATHLPASQASLRLAAQCAVLAEQSLEN